MKDKVQNPRTPENYMLVLSPFVKLDVKIKIAVPYTAKTQLHATDYGIFHYACPLISTFFSFHPAYAWLLPVGNGGFCTLFHE
jgi:hypothetical protein